MSDTPLVSVLFITYDRFHLLERTVRSFLLNTEYPNLELVVADDGSPAAVQTAIRSLPVHTFVLSRENRGLGANTNAGIAACHGKYILALQDDWDCRGPRQYLLDAVSAMERHPALGLVRFYGSIESTTPIESDLVRIDIPAVITEENRHVYSDTPHLKSRAFCDYIGPYRERVRMEECERDFEMRFLRQSRYSAGCFPRYMNTVFLHTGEAESFRTNSLLARLERRLYALSTPLRQVKPVFRFLRAGYRGGIRIGEKIGLFR